MGTLSKKPKKAVRKKVKCSTEGCRKFRVEGQLYCKSCIDAYFSDNGEDKDQSPLESVIRMTDIERLSLVTIETECMNGFLQVKNHDFEVEEIKRRFQAELNARSALREQLMHKLQSKKTEQQNLVQEICDKYKLDPKEMTYDPDTGVLRDLKKENQGST